MASTVYLDGQEQLNIGGATSAQIITEDATASVEIRADGDICLTLTEDAGATVSIVEGGEFGIITEVHTGDLPYYTGATEVTPTQETQVLSTAEKAVSNNIIINPIPKNYGLITWNGSTLTVS